MFATSRHLQFSENEGDPLCSVSLFNKSPNEIHLSDDAKCAELIEIVALGFLDYPIFLFPDA